MASINGPNAMALTRPLFEMADLTVDPNRKDTMAQRRFHKRFTGSPKNGAFECLDKSQTSVLKQIEVCFLVDPGNLGA